jgi:hypothetical protein
MIRHRAIGAAIMASTSVMFASIDVASAQSTASFCYEVIPARPNIEPPAPIMIDKCSGRSWILVRNGRASYRWSLIATETEKAKTGDRVPTEGAR